MRHRHKPTVWALLFMTMEVMHFAAVAGDHAQAHFIEQDIVEQRRKVGLFISGKYEGRIIK